MLNESYQEWEKNTPSLTEVGATIKEHNKTIRRAGVAEIDWTPFILQTTSDHSPTNTPVSSGRNSHNSEKQQLFLGTPNGGVNLPVTPRQRKTLDEAKDSSLQKMVDDLNAQLVSLISEKCQLNQTITDLKNNVHKLTQEKEGMALEIESLKKQLETALTNNNNNHNHNHNHNNNSANNTPDVSPLGSPKTVHKLQDASLGGSLGRASKCQVLYNDGVWHEAVISSMNKNGDSFVVTVEGSNEKIEVSADKVRWDPKKEEDEKKRTKSFSFFKNKKKS